MGQASKFVHNHILRFTSISRRFNTTPSNCNKFKFDSLNTQFRLKLKTPLNLSVPTNYLRNTRWSRSYLSSGIVLGVSIASASVIAHAMDAGDALVGDRCNDSMDASEEEENVNHLSKLARKLWVPVLFFLTVLANMDDPITMLVIKVALFLLTTKPNPFSVYVFVDQLCQQTMRQDTRFFKVKSLYASKVEVQDYKLLCLAAVEVRDQKFTLVGILGSWWTLPHLPYQEAFSFVRDRLSFILLENKLAE